MLTSAASYGRLLTKIKITMNTSTHEVTSVSAGNVIVNHRGTSDKTVRTVVNRYKKVTDKVANKKVTTLKVKLGRMLTRNGESYLGRVIADAQLAATKPKSRGAPRSRSSTAVWPG